MPSPKQEAERARRDHEAAAIAYAKAVAIALIEDTRDGIVRGGSTHPLVRSRGDDLRHAARHLVNAEDRAIDLAIDADHADADDHGADDFG